MTWERKEKNREMFINAQQTLAKIETAKHVYSKISMLQHKYKSDWLVKTVRYTQDHYIESMRESTCIWSSKFRRLISNTVNFLLRIF